MVIPRQSKQDREGQSQADRQKVSACSHSSPQFPFPTLRALPKKSKIRADQTIQLVNIQRTFWGREVLRPKFDLLRRAAQI